MKQFILNNEPDRDKTIRLEGKDYNYLVRVRRLATGEYFSALLPSGEETLVQIISADNGTLIGKCTPPSSSSLPPCPVCPRVKTCETLPPIILFQALPKSDKMDLIVRQAAEGGIAKIVPFVSEFSIAKAKIGGQKFLRWERIIKEARQQSGSKISTILHKPLSMFELFEYWKELNSTDALGLLFHHQQGLEQNSLHWYLDSNPKTVVFAIGPEGGFSGKEVSAFLENGFLPLTIGDTVLRSETAALYCAAAIRILLLERKSWKLKPPEYGSE